ncbi:MAG TPA: cytochrome b N-terminal domain-containing protein [Anaerolineae bacterium]|nr:cytochrome b N-terminal domain-containing protein [Anaerolineae bacterium]
MPRRRPNFYQHLHPPTIPAREARFSYTFGLGGISLLLLLVLSVTGIIEMFVYVPTPELAHESVRQITYVAPYGWLLRNVHFWAAQLMVGTVLLHMARVVFSGGYKKRRLNWLIGVALLVLTLVLDFSGYVLRWDKDTAWALMVGTQLVKEIPWIGSALYRLLVGGEAVGAAALLRFFTWHVFGLMAPAVVLVTWHAFRVRRDGGISSREREPRAGRDQLVRTELTAALLCLAGLIALSILVDAPLGPPADPTALISVPQAPWFFRWVQELLRVASPLLAGVLTPLAVLLLLSILPYTLDRSEAGIAEWFNRPGRVAQVVFLIITVGILLLTLRASLR